VAAIRTTLLILYSYFVDPATPPFYSAHPGKIGGSSLLFGRHYTHIPRTKYWFNFNQNTVSSLPFCIAQII